MWKSQYVGLHATRARVDQFSSVSPVTKTKDKKGICLARGNTGWSDWIQPTTNSRSGFWLTEARRVYQSCWSPWELMEGRAAVMQEQQEPRKLCRDEKQKTGNAATFAVAGTTATGGLDTITAAEDS